MGTIVIEDDFPAGSKNYSASLFFFFFSPGVIDTTMQNLYFPTHARATSYIVGLLYGYYLFRAKFMVQRFKLGAKTVIAGWTVATILFLVTIFSAYPLYQFEKEVSVWSSAFYVGFYRLAWSISIGWIVLACGTGHGGT